jgi:hypothetical protein
MTPVIVGAALALLALDAAPATSPPTATTPAAADKAGADPANDPDKVICKKEAITGSRFEKRICMTRAEWGEQERRTQEFERHLNETQTAHSGGGMSGQ